MTDLSRFLVLLFVLLAQIALVLVFVNATWIEEQVAKERASLEKYLGSDTATQLGRAADKTFHFTFVETGVVEYAYENYIPRIHPDHVTGSENLAPWIFRWMKKRLDTLFWWLYQSITRWHLMQHWAPFYLPFLVAAVVDGLAVRRIRIQGTAYNNSVRYKAASRLLLVLMVLPVLLLCVPIAVPPVLVPIGMVICGLILVMWCANLQHHL